MANYIHRYLSTNSFAQFVRDEIKSAIMDLNTIMPGTVVDYDSENNRAIIEPTFLIRLKHSVQTDAGITNTIQLPNLRNVPVMYQGGQNMKVSFPLKAGDTGIIFFSQRSLDEWKQFLINQTLPSAYSPKLSKQFHISDGIFFPCVLLNNTFSDNTLKWSGRLNMSNDFSSMNSMLNDLNNEILKLNATVALLSTVVASIGAVPVIGTAFATANAAQLVTIATSLATQKVSLVAKVKLKIASMFK